MNILILLILTLHYFNYDILKNYLITCRTLPLSKHDSNNMYIANSLHFKRALILNIKLVSRAIFIFLRLIPKYLSLRSN